MLCCFVEIKAYVDSILDMTVAGGIEIHGLHTTVAPRKQKARSDTVLETYQHIPYDQEAAYISSTTDDINTQGGGVSFRNNLKAYLDIVLENVRGTKLKIVEVDASESLTYSDVIPLMSTQPQLQLDYHVTDSDLSKLDSDVLESLEVSPTVWNMADDVPNQVSKSDLVIIKCDYDKEIKKCISKVKEAARESGFLLLQNVNTTGDLKNKAFLDELGLVMIGRSQDDVGSMMLCRRQREVAPSRVIDVDDLSFRWVDAVREAMLDSEEGTIWLRVSCEPLNGVIGLVNCLRQEDGGEKIR